MASNSSAAAAAAFFGISRDGDQHDQIKPLISHQQHQQQLAASLTGVATAAPTAASSQGAPPAAPPAKKKRNLPGNPSNQPNLESGSLPYHASRPDPDAEVIALSPKTLLATNRFVCEVCNKGFQREQNLQLHRRGHNLPWKLKQKNPAQAQRRRVYLCPEPTCVHHDPARALGDLTGIKKHFCRKHGEKKWKCDKCSKRYAVQSDWKAHSKICGTREYKAFCDALAKENNKLAQPMNMAAVTSALQGQQQAHHPVADDDDAAGVKSPHLKMFPDVDNTVAAATAGNPLLPPPLSMAGCMLSSLAAPLSSPFLHGCKLGVDAPSDAAMAFPPPAPAGSAAAIMSATALLQKAAELGATTSTGCYGGVAFPAMGIAGGLPAIGHHLAPYDVVVPAALQGQTATQLVGFDLGGLLPGQLYGGGGGAMTRAIGSLMHGGDQHTGVVDRRRGEGVRVVDYMGVDDDDHGSFDGVGPFGPHIGPWA
uniref:C2H2-type domain-containing protein n=1 Tax=Oryza meridionalis TaxID=40149 RepID=A0A0E0CCN9_9ORYZ